MRLTGAQALVRILAAEQVPLVAGIAGGKLAPLLHALKDEPRIPFIGTRHEAHAAIMAAAAFARVGRVAVALGEMGPGSLNLAAGAGVCFGNNLAAVLITSNQHRAAAYPHVGMFMDLDAKSLFQPITKWNATVHDPRRVPELARRAFREALSGKPGPVHLDIPQDVLAQACDFSDSEFELAPASYRNTGLPRASAADAIAAAELLRLARRPLIIAGGGVLASGAEAGVVTLGANAAGAGDSDANGSGRGGVGQPAFHRPRRYYRRRRDPAGLCGGRRGDRHRLPLLLMDVGRTRSTGAPPSPPDQHQHRPRRARRPGAACGCHAFRRWVGACRHSR